LDTYRGFRALGFNILLSLFSVVVIHFNFSYPTVPGHLPDPFFRIYLKNIHKDKHGSDSGTYDSEGRFVPQKFEDTFSKYADDRDYVTLKDVWNLLKGQRVLFDPFGWVAGILECKSQIHSEQTMICHGADRIIQGLQSISSSGPRTDA
jgi:peroxygenase